MTFNHNDHVNDTRDLIELIDDLENGIDTVSGYDKDDIEDLKQFAEELSGSPDFEYGETIISDRYFTDYARELAEDCGMVNDDLSWPNNCIDWEQAAYELKHDYFSADFQGRDYWIRG